MIAVQVMANDVAVGFGGAGGYLEMNVYKPLIIYNITHSITLLTDGCTNFRKFLVEGTKPNLKKIQEYVDRSLMLVTALAPVIGYDKASKIAHYAMDNDLTLKAAALEAGLRHRGRVRPRRRSGEDGPALRRAPSKSVATTPPECLSHVRHEPHATLDRLRPAARRRTQQRGTAFTEAEPQGAWHRGPAAAGRRHARPADRAGARRRWTHSTTTCRSTSSCPTCRPATRRSSTRW